MADLACRPQLRERLSAVLVADQEARKEGQRQHKKQEEAQARRPSEQMGAMDLQTRAEAAAAHLAADSTEEEMAEAA
jgi:hypothetical protein